MAFCEALRLAIFAGLACSFAMNSLAFASKSDRHLAFHTAGEFGCFLREGFGVSRKLLVPCGFFRLAGFFGIPLGIDVRRDVKRRVFPAQRFAGQGDFGVAQRRAVGVVGTGFVRRTGNR